MLELGNASKDWRRGENSFFPTTRAVTQSCKASPLGNLSSLLLLGVAPLEIFFGPHSVEPEHRYITGRRPELSRHAANGGPELHAPGLKSRWS